MELVDNDSDLSQKEELKNKPTKCRPMSNVLQRKMFVVLLYHWIIRGRDLVRFLKIVRQRMNIRYWLMVTYLLRNKLHKYTMISNTEIQYRLDYLHQISKINKINPVQSNLKIPSITSIKDITIINPMTTKPT